jgi:hypothetical protein
MTPTWCSNPRSRDVMGTTTTSSTGHAWTSPVDITKTGRIPPCSFRTTGSRSANHTSPRSGLDRLNRPLLPLTALPEIVGPGLRIALPNGSHPTCGAFHQRRIHRLPRKPIQKSADRRATSLSCRGEAIPYLAGHLDGSQIRHTSRVTESASQAGNPISRRNSTTPDPGAYGKLEPPAQVVPVTPLRRLPERQHDRRGLRGELPGPTHAPNLYLDRETGQPFAFDRSERGHRHDGLRPAIDGIFEADVENPDQAPTER